MLEVASSSVPSPNSALVSPPSPHPPILDTSDTKDTKFAPPLVPSTSVPPLDDSQLGRGFREKISNVKYRDYVTHATLANNPSLSLSLLPSTPQVLRIL